MFVIFDDQALTSVQASARGRREWTTFRSWAEDKRSVLLFTTDQIYSFLPKRALSVDDLARLRRCLQGAGIRRVQLFRFSGR